MGAYRIVMTGTSTALGRYVPRESTFAALLPARLSQGTGRKVELYNEGLMQGFPISSALRFNDILAAKPDLILWVVTPLDVKNASLESAEEVPLALPEPPGKPNSLTRAWYLIKTAFAKNSIPELVRNHFDRTQTSLLLRHCLYESRSLYVKSFLMGGGDADFLRTKPNAEWPNIVKKFGSDAAKFEGQAKAAGVPLVAVLVPNRAQAAMISSGEWPTGYDPYKLDNELRSIITSHGGTYLGLLSDFRRIPDPEQHYFPLDGHLDADGNAMLSELLAEELSSGAVPALKVTAQRQAALEQMR